MVLGSNPTIRRPTSREREWFSLKIDSVSSESCCQSGFKLPSCVADYRSDRSIGRGFDVTTPLDDLGRPAIADLHYVIDVVTHRHKQIEKQFAANLHLHLHGSAPLKSLATSDDQS